MCARSVGRAPTERDTSYVSESVPAIQKPPRITASHLSKCSWHKVLSLCCVNFFTPMMEIELGARKNEKMAERVTWVVL